MEEGKKKDNKILQQWSCCLFFPSLFQGETLLHPEQTRLQLLTCSWHTEHWTRLCKPQNTTQSSCFPKSFRSMESYIWYIPWTPRSGSDLYLAVWTLPTNITQKLGLTVYFCGSLLCRIQTKAHGFTQQCKHNTVLLLLWISTACNSRNAMQSWAWQASSHPVLLPQRCLPTWNPRGLKQTLKSLGHLPSFFQSSPSIRPWSGCSWSFITYQTLKGVQLVILSPLSLSLLCPPPTKTFQWQQHSGVAAWDQGSLALLPVLGLGDGSTNLNPALTPFLLPIPSAWRTRGKCSSSCHNTLA